MARPIKPRSLKVLAGTLQPCRDRAAGIEVEPLTARPASPDWLPNAYAVTEWNRLVPILLSNKLLAEGDLAALAHMCALHGKLVQLWTAGETPAASLIATLRGMQSDFGLSPHSRAKVPPTADNPSGNRFSNNGRRPPDNRFVGIGRRPPDGSQG